jgi:DNA mismatch endonuclease (patch repair protein)
VDHPIQLPALTVRPDIVFTRWRVAVFIDGCFWHRCPDHGNVPQRNLDYWVPKLERNVRRDIRVDSALTSENWLLVRAWEHEQPKVVADHVASLLASRREDVRSSARVSSRLPSARLEQNRGLTSISQL